MHTAAARERPEPTSSASRRTRTMGAATTHAATPRGTSGASGRTPRTRDGSVAAATAAARTTARVGDEKHDRDRDCDHNCGDDQPAVAIPEPARLSVGSALERGHSNHLLGSGYPSETELTLAIGPRTAASAPRRTGTGGRLQAP